MIRRLLATFTMISTASVVLTGCGADPVAVPTSRSLEPRGPSATIANLTTEPILLDQHSEVTQGLFSAATLEMPVLFADDFSVPVTWKVTQVALSGALSTPTLTFAIRRDNANVPGEQVAEFTLAPSKVDRSPGSSETLQVDDYLFTLPQPLTLPTGKYWIAVRVNDFDPAAGVGTRPFRWQFRIPSTGTYALRTIDPALTVWGEAVLKAFPDAAFVLFGEPVSAVVFDGFASPVKNAGALNSAKAGQAIALKWRITDENGQPITNLTTATIAVKDLACAIGSTVDQIAESAAGGSGLQNLGDGYYQMNWKSPSSYKGSCKTLTLTLGTGGSYSALFQFTK